MLTQVENVQVRSQLSFAMFYFRSKPINCLPSKDKTRGTLTHFCSSILSRNPYLLFLIFTLLDKKWNQDKGNGYHWRKKLQKSPLFMVFFNDIIFSKISISWYQPLYTTYIKKWLDIKYRQLWCKVSFKFSENM